MGEISGVASSLPEGANSSAMKSRSMPRSAWSSAPSSPPKLRLDLGRVGWVFGSGGGGGRRGGGGVAGGRGGVGSQIGPAQGVEG
jgi:hypothetical protein